LQYSSVLFKIAYIAYANAATPINDVRLILDDIGTQRSDKIV